MALHFWRHAEAIQDALLFRRRAFDVVEPSAQTALHSLVLFLPFLLISFTLSIIMSGRYLPRVGVSTADYLVALAVQNIAALGLVLSVGYGLCLMQGLQARFALFVTTQLWLKLVSAALILLINRATADMVFTLDQITAIGMVLYFIQLSYAWFFCWLALRCNFFYAGGVAVLMFAVAGSTSSSLNEYIFGTPRPMLTFEASDAHTP
jgi:hypothetical protein